MIITRDDVLKAIATEPLYPNMWVADQHDPKCHVCAVGAVLRQAGLDNININYTASVVTRDKFCPSAGSIPAEIADGNYLGALSMQFERFCEMAPAWEKDDWTGDASVVYVEQVVKPALIAWVKDCLPEGVLYRD